MSFPEEIDIMDVISISIRLITLFLAYKIYRNLDIKKSLRNRQLDTVLSLVQEINDGLIAVRFYTKIPDEILLKMDKETREKYPATVEGHRFTLFGISALNSKNVHFTNVYTTTHTSEILPFISYRSNPLLPKVISDELNNFWSPVTNFSSLEKASEKYVELSPLKPSERQVQFQYPDYSVSFRSWDDFIACSSSLRVEIEKWLSKYGSNELNYNFM